MKFKDIFDLGIELGMDADPRGRAAAEKVMADAAAAYEKAGERERRFFDTGLLRNPYGDSRILSGDPEAEIRRMLVGIDMDLPEMLMAQQLNAAGAGIDLIMSHHPRGIALENLPQVMELLPGSFSKCGMRLNEAQSLLAPKKEEVALSVGSGNYHRTVDAATLLGINMMCMHTPCDNQVNTYLTRLFAENCPDTLDDILDLLMDQGEYAVAAGRNNPPVIAVGSGGTSAGKIFVDMTGGAEGPAEYYSLLAQNGVSTVVCMAIGHEMLKTAADARLNVVVAGHMASDSLGVNLYLDKLESKGVDIMATSGLIRFSRN